MGTAYDPWALIEYSHNMSGAVVTASPSVAYVDVPGEGRQKIVFVASWDGNFYALRAANGSLARLLQTSCSRLLFLTAEEAAMLDHRRN